MDSKGLPATHVEDTASKDDPASSDDQNIALGLLLHNAEREQGLMASTWQHKRIIAICKSLFHFFHFCRLCDEANHFKAIAPFFCGASFGYDNVVNAATLSMPAFLIYFGELSPITHSLFLPSIWTSLFSSMSGLCQAVGSFFIGFIYERYGRKPAAVGSAVISIAGIAIQYTAVTRGALLAGKMVNCLALGGMLATGSTYISEVSNLFVLGILHYFSNDSFVL